MSLSAELMFPVRMFLPVVPVFPAAGPLFPMPAAPSVAPVFPAAGPLFPMPAAPSVAPGLSFPVQKSLAPVSVATPFLGSESQAPLFLWSDSLSSVVSGTVISVVFVCGSVSDTAVSVCGSVTVSVRSSLSVSNFRAFLRD